MSLSRRHRALVASALALSAAIPAAAVTLPPNFVAESMTPGSGFVAPTGLAFLPDGRLLVAEKGGRLWLITAGVKPASPMLDINLEVQDYKDRGLLDVAVDPNYFLNHFIYLLYTVDPDSNGVESDTAAFGRLTRYTVGFADSSTLIASSRTILMGTDFRHAPIIGSFSHTIGSLRWGRDGSLLVSAGDGANFNTVDAGGQYPSLFGPGRADPYEDIGSFRSQDLTSLDGKILRLDPATGHGYPSNPFYDGDVTSVRSRVWAYGLRNTFRFNLKPGTGSTNPALGQPGTLYLQDVGWNTWEEVDVATQGGRNFGWPCYEGFTSNAPYQSASPAHSGCGTIGTPANPSLPTNPIVSIHHTTASLSTPPGFTGNAVTGGAFYTGASYPAGYQNAYFFCDYGQDWIDILTTDSNDQLVNVQAFGTAMDGPVDLIPDPVSGDLCYAAINAGEVRRIRFVGGSVNQAPVAHASATPVVGQTPLHVTFSSAGTYDADGDSLRLSWVFGDGATALGASAAHTYTVQGPYTATLTVDDRHGNIVTSAIQLLVTGPVPFPSTPVLDDFNRPDGILGNGWIGDPGAFAVLSGAMVLTAATGSTSFPTVWSSPTQEAYFTFTAVNPNALEENLMMKVQGTAWDFGHVEINYQPRVGAVYVNTYTPGPVGWEQRGGPFPVSFGPGDQFGARLFPNGGVQVFRNGAVFGTASVVGWEFLGSGGHVGVTVSEASGSAWDNFGGGDAFPASAGVGDGAPRAVALSQAWPNPGQGAAQLTLELPAASRVDFDVLDLLGRRVWSDPGRTYGAGRWTLRWPGTRAGGSPADAGVYLARVRAGGETLGRRIVVVR